MPRSAALLSLLLLCPAAAVAEPIPPAKAAAAMRVPPGFRVTLFAGEPDLTQPIAFAFDDRGRVWAVECHSYPHWVKTPTGPDRVVILEDANGDGTFDKKTVFLENAANLSGIAFGHGGVWLTATPNVLFVPDRDGDDRPDGPPQVVLDGFDLSAKHNVVNSLVWGPDGWLWGCNGIIGLAKVGAPGTPADQRVPMNCGVWRYHVARKEFQAVAHGTTNPWGLDFDDRGEAFITNCVIDHLWHVTPGGHYERMYGTDVVPNVYDLMPSCVDYRHWAGGHWTESRGNLPQHSDAGGGHAHSGAAIYLADAFPSEYRNRLFTCNIHGARLNGDQLERTAAGCAGRRRPDLLFANDEWFRGVAVHQGPGGTLFAADWCDTGECHNYEVADRRNGRLYRLAYGTAPAWKGDLGRLADAELVRLQASPDDWLVRKARRLLHERALAKKLSPETVPALLRMFEEESDERRDLRELWALHAVGAADEALLTKLAESPSEALRVWALRLLTDAGDPSDAALAVLRARAVNEDSAFVRLNIASVLQRVPVAKRGPVAMALARREADAETQLPKMLWYALEPTVGRDPEGALALLETARLPLLRVNLARRLASLDSAKVPDLPRLLVELGRITDPAVVRDALTGVQRAFAGRRSVPMPAGWAELAPRVLSAADPALRGVATELALLFDDPAAAKALEAVVRSNKPTPERERALAVLLQRQRPELAATLIDLLDDDALRGAAIRGLAAYAEPRTPGLLVTKYKQLTPAERADAVATLSSRPAFAAALLGSVAHGAIPRQDVPLVAVRQMQGMKDPEVQSLFAKVWGDVKAATAEQAAAIARYREMLAPGTLAKADLASGRRLYAANCASCHKLFGEGGAVGPELTGSQRFKLDYVLENVVTPDAVVPRDYQVSVIELSSGRVVNGIVRAETPETLTVQTANETLSLPKSEVESRTVTGVSLMPGGLLDRLTPAEVRDLVGYLGSPVQVGGR